VTSALMHEPSDSSLLWDAVRVMVRLLKRADNLVGGAGSWRDHCRAAKKRARKIQFTRGRPNRVQLYRELIAITRATLAYLKHITIGRWSNASSNRASGACWPASRYRPARSLGITAAFDDDIGMLFEQADQPGKRAIGRGEHTSHRTVADQVHGHKLNLTTGRSGIDPRSGDRSRQPGRKRPLAADAGAPHRPRWSSAANAGLAACA
jgi:IS5 family transposase